MSRDPLATLERLAQIAEHWVDKYNILYFVLAIVAIWAVTKLVSAYRGRRNGK